MKRMIYINDDAYGLEEEVFDTGKRKTVIDDQMKYTYHWVQRKRLWFKFHTWVRDILLKECPKVEYWEEEV